MTKQEAIKILEKICPKRPQKLWSIKRKEAVKMAIEALSELDNNSTEVDNRNDELSCSAFPNRSEPKTAESGSVEKEMPEIKSNRTTGGMIYRQDAIYYVKQATIGETDVMKAWVKAQTHLMRLPSAQPERKKGEWIDYTEDGYVECPFCHSATNCDGNKDELHFCFSCGADMRGEQNE